MADFCRQCSIKIFGEDHKDLADLISTGPTLALCEGCGYIQVDINGQCIDDGCPIHSKQLRTAE